MEIDLSSSAPQAADVRDVTLSSFKADVLEASKKALVLLLFWTPRDKGCVEQSKTLEKIVQSGLGPMALARIDIDRDQTVARQLGVQSVPSVFAFYQARPVDAFEGAMPEAQIKTWVAQILKTTGAGDAVGFDTALQQAEGYRAAKDVATARAIYADILEQDTSNAKAYAGLIACLLDEGNAAQARRMLDEAPQGIAGNKALDSVRAATELAEETGQNKGMAETLEAEIAKDPHNWQARFDLALAYYAAQRHEEAADQLLEIVRFARTWNDGAARKQLVKFFEAWGETNPVTLSARRRLSSILFS